MKRLVILLIANFSLVSCAPINFDKEIQLTSKSQSCETDPLCATPPPLVTTPGVVTILLALGDKDNMPNPTVDQVSAISLAEKMIQYASPVFLPKVLVVLDKNNQGESPDDFVNLWKNLLIKYAPDHMNEPNEGLSANDIVGYDVVWLVNPGHNLGNEKTYETLKGFTGGVILSGDNMSQGAGFEINDLTGLTFVDNGHAVTCSGNSFDIDNNVFENYYNVTLDATKFTDLSTNHLEFRYGNDIDNTIATPALEVLAWAQPSPSECSDKRPVVTRYPKN